VKAKEALVNKQYQEIQGLQDEVETAEELQAETAKMAFNNTQEILSATEDMMKRRESDVRDEMRARTEELLLRSKEAGEKIRVEASQIERPHT